jgi:hypothetical protein
LIAKPPHLYHQMMHGMTNLDISPTPWMVNAVDVAIEKMGFPKYFVANVRFVSA